MKKIIALLLALAMVFALAACGGNSKSDDAAPAAANSADSAPAAESDGDAAAPATGDGKLTGTLMLGEIGPPTGGAAPTTSWPCAATAPPPAAQPCTALPFPTP
jgi:branched-chain amino acid transport system substrate-binding protein